MTVQEEVLRVTGSLLYGLRRDGADNVAAFCPFHPNADTPAFRLSLSRGVWLCYGCHARGNFPQLLELLGVDGAFARAKYGNLLDELGNAPGKPTFNPLRPAIDNTPVDESILGVFHACPMDLINEGFTEETLLAFGVGFDQKNQRITFPLRDMSGKLVGISGRTVAGDSRRYKVYVDEYLAYGLPRGTTNKNMFLWNAHSVYPAVYFSTTEIVLLVEGFKACMWMVQSGISNTVALLGSSMSEAQQWILERLGAPVYLMLDNNAAGHSGRRSIAERLIKSLDVKIVQYEQEQPDKIDPAKAGQLIADAVDYFAWVREERNHHGLRQNPHAPRR